MRDAIGEPISGHPRPSSAIRRNQAPSEAIKRHPMTQSEALTWRRPSRRRA
jgi:hypothetical protein